MSRQLEIGRKDKPWTGKGVGGCTVISLIVVAQASICPDLRSLLQRFSCQIPQSTLRIYCPVILSLCVFLTTLFDSNNIWGGFEIIAGYIKTKLNIWTHYLVFNLHLKSGARWKFEVESTSHIKYHRATCKMIHHQMGFKSIMELCKINQVTLVTSNTPLEAQRAFDGHQICYIKI